MGRTTRAGDRGFPVSGAGCFPTENRLVFSVFYPAAFRFCFSFVPQNSFNKY